MENPNPTGEEMVDRSRRVYDMVKEVLINFPQTRGDHMLLYITVLRKYYWKLVRVTTKPTLKLEYASFDSFFLCPAAETVRRRAQEIQHDERERIWQLVAANLPQLAFMPDFRDQEVAKAEFVRLARTSQLLPSERVIRKRWRNQSAQFHEFSYQQMSLNDIYSRS